MQKKRINLVLVVSRLNKGGTEVQILELVRALNPLDYVITLITFYSQNQLWQSAVSIPNLNCVSLKKKSRWDLGFFVRFVSEIKKHNPQIIYSFLSTANLICLLAHPFVLSSKLIWGIRTSRTDFSYFDTFSKVVARVEGLLARFVTLVIANSEAGKLNAIRLGVPEKKIHVVFNGIDTDRFVPNSEMRSTMRKKLNITEEEILVGIVGRFDPLKDHKTFLKAAKLVANKRQNIKFLLVGVNATDIPTTELEGKLHFTGLVDDPLPYYQAMDLFCSSSITEGFSNAIAEAMSVGLPCAVTDVGDSKKMVGETGWVVKPQDAEGLAEGILLQLSRQELAKEEMSLEARSRIIKNFSRENLGKRTGHLFQVDFSKPLLDV